MWRQKMLKQGLSPEGSRRVDAVASVTAGAWLDALPVASNCLLGDWDVVSSLRYMLGECPAVMQDTPLVCECGKPFSPAQAMRCSCCAGVRTVCHDISVEMGWRACVHESEQASTRDPLDSAIPPVWDGIQWPCRKSLHLPPICMHIVCHAWNTCPKAPLYRVQGLDRIVVSDFIGCTVCIHCALPTLGRAWYILAIGVCLNADS